MIDTSTSVFLQHQWPIFRVYWWFNAPKIWLIVFTDCSLVLLDKDMSGSGPRLSGMQKQVLGLYRGFLRAARLKSPDDRLRIESIVSTEFRQNAKNVDRKNFLYIEYLLRRGKKQLEQLKSHDTVTLSTVNVCLNFYLFFFSPFIGLTHDINEAVWISELITLLLFEETSK